MKNYLDFRNKIEYEKIQKQAQIIKQGGLVVFPTETVYGIGTNGLDEKAIEKLYKIKQRPLNKPISLLVSNMKMIEELATNINEIEYKIMGKFFPGPLTIILKKKNIVPDILTANTDTVGIRMPEGIIAEKLIEYAKQVAVDIIENDPELIAPEHTNINNLINTKYSQLSKIIQVG